MTLVRIADRWFSLTTSRRDGGWTSGAVCRETGQRFEPELLAESEAASVAALTRWLEWQAEHAAALEALQHAERAYHRSVTSGAFATSDDGDLAAERRAAALRALDQARRRLDDVRGRQPV